MPPMREAASITDIPQLTTSGPTPSPSITPMRNVMHVFSCLGTQLVYSITRSRATCGGTQRQRNSHKKAQKTQDTPAVTEWLSAVLLKVIQCTAQSSGNRVTWLMD